MEGVCHTFVWLAGCGRLPNVPAFAALLRPFRWTVRMKSTIPRIALRLLVLTLTSLPIATCVASSVLAGAGESVTQRVLWSDKPVVFSESQAGNIRYAAVAWSNQVFPLGNGRLGCTVFGDPAKERIQFNEDSLWVGNEHCTGGYQPFGDLYVETGHEEFTDYRRELDLSRAVQTVTYRCGGVKFKREYFSSYPAQVMVYRFTADKPESHSGKIWLDHVHRSKFAKEQLDNPKAGDAITTTAQGSRPALTISMRSSSSSSSDM